MTPVIEIAGEIRLVADGAPTVEPSQPAVFIKTPPDLELHVSHVGGRIVVAERRTAIYGEGATHLDAIKDFHRAVREHIDVLENESELSPALAEQLEYLRARVRP